MAGVEPGAGRRRSTEAETQKRCRGRFVLLAPLTLVLACAGGSEEADTDTPVLPTATDTESPTGGTAAEPTTSSAPSTTAPTGDTDPSGGSSGGTSCDAPPTWYEDADDDGFGNPFAPKVACEQPAGHADNPSDCDDEDGEVHPGADEVCDGVDNNCDGETDEATDDMSCTDCELLMDGVSTYGFCPTATTFDDARTFCQTSFGGDLVVIGGEPENTFITNANVATAGMSHWIGLSDQATEGTFVWVDGSPLDYTNWNELEPNDAGGMEDCAELGLGVGGWNDLPCAELRPFICEWT